MKPTKYLLNTKKMENLSYETIDLISKIYGISPPKDIIRKLQKDILKNIKNFHGRKNIEQTLSSQFSKIESEISDYFLKAIENGNKYQHECFLVELERLQQKHPEPENEFIRKVEDKIREIGRPSFKKIREEKELLNGWTLVEGKIYICAFCGWHYEQPNNVPHSRYCSDECKLAAYTKRRREKSSGRNLMRVCPGCGKEFTPKRITGICCSTACRVALHRQKKIE